MISDKMNDGKFSEDTRDDRMDINEVDSMDVEIVSHEEMSMKSDGDALMSMWNLDTCVNFY